MMRELPLRTLGLNESAKQWVADAEQTYSTILVEESIKIRMTEPQRHVEKLSTRLSRTPI